MRRLFTLLLAATAFVFSACTSTRTYSYRYVPGRTATVENGFAVAPEKAPESVRAVIDAGNRIAGSPYGYGGGHGNGAAPCFDCSGATSYLLKEAGLLRSAMPSRGFRRYGKSGDGRWITVWARKGHVFLVVAGLRFDTGWHGGANGPRWTTMSRPARGYVFRHPSGL